MGKTCRWWSRDPSASGLDWSWQAIRGNSNLWSYHRAGNSVVMSNGGWVRCRSGSPNDSGHATSWTSFPVPSLSRPTGPPPGRSETLRVGGEHILPHLEGDCRDHPLGTFILRVRTRTVTHPQSSPRSSPPRSTYPGAGFGVSRTGLECPLKDY